jgi:nitrate/nitrite-specific signal transduction histidine kinase
MSRKTPDQILQSKNTDEIHDWLEAADLPELRRCLRKVVRESSVGQHVRDALDILIATDNQKTAKWLFWLTMVTVVCAIIQAVGVFWMIFHAR